MVCARSLTSTMASSMEQATSAGTLVSSSHFGGVLISSMRNWRTKLNEQNWACQCSYLQWQCIRGIGVGQFDRLCPFANDISLKI